MAATRLSAWRLWGTGAWIGLLLGLTESAFLIARRALEGWISSPDLWVNWNAPWMAPVGMVLLLTGVSIVFSATRLVLPRISRWLWPRVLLALGVWSILSVVPGLQTWAIKLLAVGVAIRLGGRLPHDYFASNKRVRMSLPIAVGIWFILILCYGVWPASSERIALAMGRRPDSRAPNVLMIVLDTVRAENMSIYGYSRRTTPHLEQWALRGTRFEQARATTPFTLGTHASLFTGNWMSDTSAGANSRLDRQERTLAEHLASRGYATAGFVGNIFYGSEHYGLNRGFHRWYDVPGNITRRVTPREIVRSCQLGASLLAWSERKLRILAPMQRQRLDARSLNHQALRWLDQVEDSDRPFFLFMNYFDAHSPYTLPPEAPHPFARIPAESLEPRLQRLSTHIDEPGLKEASGASIHEGEREQVYALVRDAYDDGIAWMDRQLDSLLRELDRRGHLNNTLVIITSDHGELLGEHNLFGHGNGLFRQVVHVPLLIFGPSRLNIPQERSIAEPVSLRDVPATVLHLIGDPDRSAFPGQSLSRFWSQDPNAAASADLVLSEVEHMHWMSPSPRMPPSNGPMWLLTAGCWSYHRQEHETEGPIEALYHLAEDPDEANNRATRPEDQPILSLLRARLTAWRDLRPPRR